MNKPINLTDHPILQQAFDVIQAIEKCGASIELTNAVTEAGKLMTAINELIALKGDQVPVAWTDSDELRDAEKGYCGYLYKIDPLNKNIDPRRQIMLFTDSQIPVSPPVGEIVAWNHPNEERNVDFRFFRFDVKPGTKLYAIEPAPAMKSDLFTRAEALAVETRALANRIQEGE